MFSAAATQTWLTEVEGARFLDAFRSKPGQIGKVGKGSNCRIRSEVAGLIRRASSDRLKWTESTALRWRRILAL